MGTLEGRGTDSGNSILLHFLVNTLSCEAKIPMFSIRSSAPFCICFYLALLPVVQVLAQEATETGAFIVVSKEGEVQVLDAGNQLLPDEYSSTGKTLLEGQTIKTGATGKIILLLSSGTLTTVEENSLMILDNFRQKLFDQEDDKTIGDLEEEPSNSEVKLKLGYGSVVFNVKKLNPGSSFEIDSPVGMAGIRGTDGQLEVKINPDNGNFTGGVNMLSGTVNFRTVDGVNLLVNAGQSIFSQVSLTGQQIGQIQRRPVPPEMTQRLNQRTNLAKDSSQGVKIEKINQARQEAVQKFKENPRKPEDKNDGNSQNRKNSGQQEGNRNKNGQNEPKDTKFEKIKTTVQKRLGGGESGNENSEKLMEVDDQADLAQKGVVLDKENARKLQAMGLTKDDLSELSKVDKVELKTLLQEENTEEQQANIRNQIIRSTVAEKLQSYENSERVILEQFSIDKQFQLLSQLQPGQINKLLETYTPDTLSSVLSLYSISQTIDLELAELAEVQTLLSQNSNEDVLEKLLATGGGTLDDTLLDLARQTNELLSIMVTVGTLETEQMRTFGQLSEISVYTEPISLAETIFSEANISPILAYASRKLFISESLDLFNVYVTQQKSRFAITARKSIQLEGIVELSPGTDQKETHLSILAGESLTFASDTEVNFAGDHFYLGSVDSMEIVNVSMESGSSLHVQTLEDLVLSNSDLRVRGRDEIHLQAAMDLRLNGVNFSNHVREIYMQAITIDLRNINFPAGSLVNLATQLGGIDGKYPTFPTGDTQDLLGNREIGRVNFIQNVQYNQNLLNNRAQFDQFGQNIYITTRP